jgi:hypothetical protein
MYTHARRSLRGGASPFRDDLGVRDPTGSRWVRSAASRRGSWRGTSSRYRFEARLSHKSDARDRSLFRGIIFVAIGIQKASDRLISEVELATPVDH